MIGETGELVREQENRRGSSYEEELQGSEFGKLHNVLGIEVAVRGLVGGGGREEQTRKATAGTRRRQEQ